MRLMVAGYRALGYQITNWTVPRAAFAWELQRACLLRDRDNMIRDVIGAQAQRMAEAIRRSRQADCGVVFYTGEDYTDAKWEGPVLLDPDWASLEASLQHLVHAVGRQFNRAVLVISESHDANVFEDPGARATWLMWSGRVRRILQDVAAERTNVVVLSLIHI